MCSEQVGAGYLVEASRCTRMRPRAVRMSSVTYGSPRATKRQRFILSGSSTQLENPIKATLGLLLGFWIINKNIIKLDFMNHHTFLWTSTTGSSRGCRVLGNTDSEPFARPILSRFTTAIVFSKSQSYWKRATSSNIWKIISKVVSGEHWKLMTRLPWVRGKESISSYGLAWRSIQSTWLATLNFQAFLRWTTVYVTPRILNVLLMWIMS